MEDVAGKISLYHNLFLVCLVLCILCLILSVVLFFVLDIRNVLGYLTGRRAKKQIQALQESNAASGRLMPRERTNMQYVNQEMKEDMGVRGTAMPGARKVDNLIQDAPGHDNVQMHAGENTTVLQENAGSQDTSVLSGQLSAQQPVMQQQNVMPQPAMQPQMAGQQPAMQQQMTGQQPTMQQPMMQQSMVQSQTAVQPAAYNVDGSTAALNREQARMGTFVIEKEIIYIHAEEVI